MGLERDLAEARLQVGQLEACEANWVACDAKWVNMLTDRLHAIVGLQEQREQQREELDQLKDERFVHLQALVTWMDSLRPWTRTWRLPTN
jgi:hypothetical protein